MEIKQEGAEIGVQPSKTSKSIKIIFAVLLAISAASTLGLVRLSNTQGEAGSTNTNTKSGEANYNILNEIQEVYKDKYIKGTYSSADAYDGVLKGFVEGTGDKYGRYLNPEEAKQFTAETNSELTGIGIEVSLDSEASNSTKIVIQNVYKDSPAEEAGLKKGDTINTIDGKDVSKLSFSNVMSSIRGKSGSELNITIVSDQTERSIKLIRRELHITDISYQVLEGNIGYINLKRFNRETASTFKEVLTVMRDKAITKYVFDLRGNGGGLVDTAVEIIDAIVPKGLIVKTVNNKGKDTDYNSDSNETNGTMIVLVDENTASAAELFALVLRDYSKAKVVGVKTYGKGTMVDSIRLKNGGLLILSTGLFYTKHSLNIEGVGIIPDVEVHEGEDLSDTQLDRALSLLQ